MEETILIVGDHDIVRNALRERLEIAFPPHPVIQAANKAEVAGLVIRRSPRLIVVDIGLPAAEQLEVVRHIKTVQPSMQIVVWTIHDWVDYRTDALAAGATAYVLKEKTQEKLLAVLTILLTTQPDPSYIQTQ